MKHLDFNNSPYSWEFNDLLNDKVNSLRFKTVEEIEMTSELFISLFESNLEAIKWMNQNIKRINSVNADLREDILDILETIVDPETNISTSYVLESPKKFIPRLNPEAEITEEQIQQFLNKVQKKPIKVEMAYMMLGKTIIAEKGQRLKELNIYEKEAWIKKIEDKKQEAQAFKEILQDKKAPAPGTEKSTATLELINLFGGMHAVEQIIEGMKQEKGILQCYELQGGLQGEYLDEDNIHWNFRIYWEDREIIIDMNNIHTISFDAEKEGIAPEAIHFNNYPMHDHLFVQGTLHFKPQTILDILLTHIKALSTKCYAMAYCDFSGKEHFQKKLMHVLTKHLKCREEIRNLIDAADEVPKHSEELSSSSYDENMDFNPEIIAAVRNLLNTFQVYSAPHQDQAPTPQPVIFAFAPGQQIQLLSSLPSVLPQSQNQDQDLNPSLNTTP